METRFEIINLHVPTAFAKPIHRLQKRWKSAPQTSTVYLQPNFIKNHVKNTKKLEFYDFSFYESCVHDLVRK